MKKVLQGFTVAIIMCLLCLVLMPTFTVKSNADEVSTIYTYEDEIGYLEIKILDDTNCEIKATQDGTTAIVTGNYTLIDNVLTVNVLGEKIGEFTVDGTTLTPIEEVVEDNTDTKIDELIAKLENKVGSTELTDALQDYLSTYENENIKYFSEKILPIVIACAFLMVGGLVLIVPNVKKSKKYNQAVAYIKNLENLLNEKTEEIKAIKDNAELVKQAQNEFLNEFAKETAKLSLDMNLFSKISASEKENKALLESIKNGMIYICKDDAEAIKIFTQTASEKVVEEDEKKIVNLENEIRKLSSDNAEEIIKNAEQV